MLCQFKGKPLIVYHPHTKNENWQAGTLTAGLVGSTVVFDAIMAWVLPHVGGRKAFFSAGCGDSGLFSMGRLNPSGRPSRRHPCPTP